LLFGFASGNEPAFMRRLIDDSDMAKSTSKSAILTLAESGNESKFCIEVESVKIILHMSIKGKGNHEVSYLRNHFKCRK
jgi:hypothetical protein